MKQSILALLSVVSLTAACGGGADSGSAADPVSQCGDDVYAYAHHIYECWPDQFDDTPRATAESACAAQDSVWLTCDDQVASFQACGEAQTCDDWVYDCWSEYRDLEICLGDPDPGDSPPSQQASCPWTDDGECDEPEGTNLCAEGTDVDDCASGPSNTCDPSYCSGCQYECSGDYCYSCCYSCSGDQCAQTCTD